MKKTLGIIVAIGAIIILSITFFLKKENVSVGNSENWRYDYVMRASYSNRELMYNKDNYIHYLDADSGKDVVICTDTTCDHKNKKCMAYFEAANFVCKVENDKLLMVTDYKADKLGELYLYESDINGANRKKITKLDDNIQVLEDVIINKDYIIVAYRNQYDDNLEELDLPVAGLYVYNRKNGEGHKVYEKKVWNAIILSLDLHEDTMYYSLFGYNVTKKEALLHSDSEAYMEKNKICKICSINIDGKNYQEITDADNPTVLMPYKNEYFYNNAKKLYSYNIITGEKRELGDEMLVIPSYCKNILYFSKYDKLNNANILYGYNGKMDKIGVLKKNYGINAIFDNVVYISNYGGEGSGFECVKKIEDILE